MVFNSHELPKPTSPTAGFARSLSCDSNLFNNKTGFTQSTIPPPVASVAPLRDPYYHPQHNHHYHSHHIHAQSQSSLLELEKVGGVEPFHHDSCSSSSSASSSSSLTFSPGSDLHIHQNHPYHHREENLKMQQKPSHPPLPKSNTVMVSPLQHNNMNNHNHCHVSPNAKRAVDVEDESLLKKSELSLRVNCTSDVGSQTETKEKIKNGGASPTQQQLMEQSRSSSASSSSSGTSSCSSSFDDSSGRGGSSSSSSTRSKGSGSSGINGNSANPFSVIASYTGRQKSQEELECEELSRSLIKKLPQGDKLQKILGNEWFLVTSFSGLLLYSDIFAYL